VPTPTTRRRLPSPPARSVRPASGVLATARRLEAKLIPRVYGLRRVRGLCTMECIRVIIRGTTSVQYWLVQRMTPRLCPCHAPCFDCTTCNRTMGDQCAILAGYHSICDSCPPNAHMAPRNQVTVAMAAAVCRVVESLELARVLRTNTAFVGFRDS
jgi:hypothetical protein